MNKVNRMDHQAKKAPPQGQLQTLDWIEGKRRKEE